MSNHIDAYLEQLKEGVGHQHLDPNIHHTDMADYLEEVKRGDEAKFFEHFDVLPFEQKAKTLLELPSVFQEEVLETYDAPNIASLVEVLKSDDASSMFALLLQKSPEKEEQVFNLLSDKRQEEIEQLGHYSEDEAGSLMQTELFKVFKHERIVDGIKRLMVLKREGIGRIESVFVTDEHDKLLKTIYLDDLLLEDDETCFESFMDKYPHAQVVSAHEHIDFALKKIEQYDLTVLAVVDRRGHLIGRITHDDMVDSLQKKATQQMYNLNKLHADEEIEESFTKTTKTRSVWLTVNLINAILASLVIGLFEHTLETVVALAVLMPIVANMAGTASVQSMTIVVRQMGIGELNFKDIRPILIKEMSMASVNGLLFAFLSMAVAYFWFGQYLIAYAIGLSMFVSFIFAGLLGATVPMLVKKVGLDPAIASSVIVITLIDIIGFFSFLWFAEMLVL